jgi:hypothetical protein
MRRAAAATPERHRDFTSNAFTVDVEPSFLNAGAYHGQGIYCFSLDRGDHGDDFRSLANDEERSSPRATAAKPTPPSQ